MALKTHLGPLKPIPRPLVRWVPAASIICAVGALVGCATLCLGLFLHFLANAQGFTPTQARLVYAGVLGLAGACWLRPGGQLVRFVGHASASPSSRSLDLLAAVVQLAAWVTLLFSIRKLIHYGSSSRPVPIHWEIALGLAIAVLGYFHLTDRTAWMGVLNRGARGRSWLTAKVGRTARNCGTQCWRWLAAEVSEASGPRRRACLVFGGFGLALAIGLSWLPLQQAWATGGVLCYQNAFDEYSYLQYEYSATVAGLNRVGQLVVQLGHRIGLSGGWINLLMDLGCMLGFLAVSRSLFRGLGSGARGSWLAALALALTPMLFSGGYNPWLGQWFYWLLDSGSVYWVTAPQAWFLPLSRSPEPQFSLLLIALATAIAVKRRSYWPAYLVVPFLYPFVLLPYLFCLVVLHVARPGTSPGRLAAAFVLAYVLLAAGGWVQIAFLTKPAARSALTESHLPLVSTTGVIALILCATLWKLIDPSFRRAALVIAVAPTAVNNVHVLTGYFGAPHNFEQCGGVVCCALILVLATLPWLRYRGVEAVVLAGLLLLAWDHGADCWQNEQQIVAQLRLTPELLTALREAPEEVVVDDPNTAGLLAMVYPRLKTTPFGWQNTYGPLAQSKYPRYVHARQTILADPQLAAQFAKAIHQLDALYRYESADFILLHNGRRTEFPEKHVPESVAVPPTPARLRLFVGGVLVGRTGEAADSASRMTPSP